jgi:HD-like signal output (HDOD) protein
MSDFQDYLAQKHLLDDVLKDVEALVSIPEIYQKFRQLMEKPNSTLAEYQKVVSCDPNIAAMVLKLVNSPLYGFSGRITDLGDAIRMAGLNKFHDLVLVASMMKLDYSNDILPLRDFWRCSLFSGILASSLGKLLKMKDSEDMYIVGLLHKIGCLVIYSKYPEQAKKSVLKSKKHNQPDHAAELAVLGFHYGQVGGKLMALWRLPMALQVATYYQTNPLDAPIEQQKTALLHVVHGYAQQYLYGDAVDLAQLILPEAWAVAKCEPEQVEAMLAQTRELTEEIEKMVLV